MSEVNLHWIKEGRGPIVVLSHALGCDLHMWDGVVQLLRGRYTLLRYDHRGHGQSAASKPHDALAQALTIDMLADDAAQLIEAQAGESVHFVGLSMGGMVAQALAHRHPQWVKSITVANAALHYDDAAKALWAARIATVQTQGMAAVVNGAMQRWLTPEFREDTVDGGAEASAALAAQLAATDPVAYADACQAVADIDFRASNLTLEVPTLVISGQRDEATPPALSQLIADSIRGAHLRSLYAAHLSAVEQPQAFAHCVEQFLDAQ